MSVGGYVGSINMRSQHMYSEYNSASEAWYRPFVMQSTVYKFITFLNCLNNV